MRRKSNLVFVSILFYLTLPFSSSSTCFAETCGSYSLCTTNCVDFSNGCPLKAYGINVQILKIVPGVPKNTYYIRVAAGGTGKIIDCEECKNLAVVYAGSTDGAAFNGALLNSKGSPVNTCPSIFGYSICALPDTNGAVLTVQPGVGTSTGRSSSDDNRGPSTSTTLSAANVQEVDTGMLGSSSCDVRPSLQRSDPINVGSGNVYRNEIDAVINSGKIGAFSFERNYNSLNGELSSFGYGWQHNFNIKVIGSSTLQEGDGRRTPFYFLYADLGQQLQIFGSPPGVTDSLFQTVLFPPTFSLKKRDGTNFLFTSATANPPKYISQITDRNSNGIGFTYTNGKLTRITETGGRYYDLFYFGNRIDTLKNQAGTTLATYEYYIGADTNYLKKVTYGDNSWEEYTYETSGTPKKLKKVLTSDSNAYFYDYDSQGRAKTSYRTTGKVDKINVTYDRGITAGSDGDSIVAVVTDTLGNLDTLISYPNALATDRLLRRGRNASSCGSCAARYAYDTHSNLIRKISPIGVIDQNSYDAQDRVITRVEDSAGFARTHGSKYANYDLVSRDSTSSIVDGTKYAVKIFNYDANGNDTLAVDSGLVNVGAVYSDTTLFTYNSSGQVLTIDGPRAGINDLTRFTYNSTTGDLDSVIEYTGTDSLKTAYTSYDAFGNPLTVIGPNSDTTFYQYDKRERVQKIKRSKGSSVDSTRYQYNFAGNITQITLPLGNTIKYGYDLAGRLDTIVNGAGDSMFYTYDLMSNRKSERIRKGSTLYKTTYYSYDSRSRLTQVCVGDSSDTAKYDCTSFGYDAVGNRTEQLSARGDSTHFRYDALNRLDTIIQKHDGSYDTTLYTYDLQDNLTKVTDPSGYETRYNYSDRGHLIYDSSGASGVTKYVYDPAGNLVKKIPATGDADSVSFSYDALNRQTQILTGGSTLYTFDYDASATDNRKGRLWRETGPIETRKFSYDYVGRVSRESVTVSGRTYYIGYTWDKNGNLTTLRYPDGRTVTYTFDLADRPFKAVGVKQGVVKTYFDSTYYLPFGPDTTMKLGNGIKVRHYFNRKLYPDSITNSVAGKFGRSYQYDHNGNITQLLDLIDNTKSYDTLKYDGVDRLLIAKGNNRSDSLHFSYSGNGNRLTKKKNTSVTNYNYSNNRLTSTTGAEAVTYGYNSNGSITSDGTPTYAYDKLNRIVKITGISPTDTFAYDGENRRIYSSDSGLTFVNIYDIYGNMLSQYIPGSAFYTTDYIWANGEPRMKIDTLIGGLGPLAPPSNPETQFWYHTDHLGTPYVSTDSFKTVRWKISLDPFGERVSEQNPSTNNLRFPGQYFDRGSGLDYNWNRYYQPKIGRYYQVDYYFEFNVSRDYLYADNNPVIFTDPNGTFSYQKGGKTPPKKVNAEMEKKILCVEKCLGRALVVTGGAEAKGHLPGSQHPKGRAVDFGFRSNPGLEALHDKFFCCAGKCGFKYGNPEGIGGITGSSAPHFHIQTVLGRAGAHGDIPDSCKECK